MSLTTTFTKLATCGLALVVLATGELNARPKKREATNPNSASEKPASTVRTSSHLRVWRVSENASAPGLTVTLKPAVKPADAAKIEIKPGRFDFSEYVDVAMGVSDVEIVEAPDSNRPPVRLSLALVDGASATLILRQDAAGVIAPEVVDEAVTGSGDLTVYNFLPAASGDVSVAVGDAMTSRVVAMHGEVRVRGLPRQNFIVALTSKGADGKPLHWSSDVDFRQLHRASMLIFPDAYGRIRPRLIANGEAVGASVIK